LIDRLEKAAAFRIRLSGLAGLGIVKTGRVPAVIRDFADGIDAAAEQFPKCVRRVGPSRKSAANADDRDGETPGSFGGGRRVR